VTAGAESAESTKNAEKCTLLIFNDISTKGFPEAMYYISYKLYKKSSSTRPTPYSQNCR
jgi:hypothetical protein